MLGGWLLVISGIATLSIAANSKQKVDVCKDILIGMKGNEGKFYVEKEDVLKLMEKTMDGSLLQRSVSSIDLSQLEKGLKTNPWIKNAELYFDSKDALHVFIEEREPIARVFTTEDNSFYMDSSGSRMPLLDKTSIRVPVVTGFTNAKKFKAADSSLLEQTKNVVQFISGNSFWNAQIGQIDITPERKFELIPVIGNHIIKLGSGENVKEKLNRLYVFYKQVMSKVGFNKYAVLDIEFNGQVVAVKKQTASPVDSIQLKKNIEQLMNKANMQTIDENMLPAQNLTTTYSDSSIKTADVNAVPTKTNSNPIATHPSNISIAKKKAESKSTPKKIVTVSKPKPNLTERKPNVIMKKPKAVMPKRNEY